MRDYFEDDQELFDFLEKAKLTSKLSDEEKQKAEVYAEATLNQDRMEYNAHMAQSKVIASGVYLTV